jgi:predicted ATPase
VAQYLASEALGALVPEGLATLIYRHSEGNPLFMLTILDHLRSRNLIALENGFWQIKACFDSIYLEVPESLRQLIELQIERLSPEEQRALEIASVTGPLFTANVEALGAAMDHERFETVCEELSRREHIVRRVGSRRSANGTISQCYEFVYALYREVFYRRQTPGQLARLRLSIGMTSPQTLLPSARNAISLVAGV